MVDPDAELAALYDHHRAAGDELADQLIRSVLQPAPGPHEYEMFISSSRWARLLREGLATMSDEMCVSAAICLMARFSRGEHPPMTTGLHGPSTGIRAVRAARPRFNLQDLRILLQFDSAYLSVMPEGRIEYFAMVLDRAGELQSEGVPGAISVIDEVSTRLTNWQPTELRNRAVVGLRKLRDEASSLSGRPISPVVEVKPVEAADGYGIAVLALLGTTEPWAPGVNALLTHIGSASSAAPSRSWERRFAELVIVVDSPGELIRALLELLVTAPAVEVQTYRGVMPLLLGPSDDVARGLAWAAGILAEPWAPRVLQQVAARCLRESRGRSIHWVTVRGEKVPFACFQALGRIGTAEAIAVLGQFVQTIAIQTVLKRVLGALTSIAAERRLTLAQLLEQNIPSYELDEDGSRRMRVGEGAVHIHLDDRAGAALSWTTDAGVEAVVPSDVAASFPEEVADAALLLADVKKAAQVERLRIESLLAGERTWSLGEFLRGYVQHPLTGWYGRRLLWLATTAGEDRLVGVPSPAADRSLVTIGGATRSLPPDSVLSLWHPVKADQPEVDSAREFLSSRAIHQPFRQAWREVYRPDAFEQDAQLYSDRFAGHILRNNQLYAPSKQRGWADNYLSAAWDGGQSARCHRDFPDAGVRVVWLMAGMDWDRPDPPANLCVSDRIHFEVSGEQRPVPIPITEIPARVFSEAMRDVDLFVSACTVATDLLWLERLSGERQLGDYWERVAAEGLGTTTALRRQALGALLAEGLLAGPFTLDERFLVVAGNWGTYKIELTTANVLLEPPGKWLSVDVRSSPSIADLVVHRSGRPSGDDEVLDRILIRARTLAADDRIRDKRFVDQVRSALANRPH